MLFKELLNLYLKDKPRSPYSVINIRTTFERHILPILGNKDIQKITTKDAREYLFYLEHKKVKRMNKHLAPATKASIYRYCICLFNFAIRENFLDKNPFTILRVRFKESAAPIKILTPEEAIQLLHANYVDKQYKFYVYLGLCAGLRRGEIRALRWEDIDLEHKILHICRTSVFYNAEIYFKLPKNNQRRYIPISDILYNFLIKYKKHTDTEGEIISMRPDCLTVWFTKFANKQGLNISFKGLRKTFGSLLLQNQTNIYDVSHLLGHSSIKVTERNYLGISYTIQKDAVNRLYK